jgi:hypothetical protein
MIKKKCPSCEKRTESKFNFCPNCGIALKAKKRNSFGMLGNNDTVNQMQTEVKLPFGMEKMMGSLVKQLEKQMGSINLNDAQGMPKGIKIRVARNPNQMGQMMQPKPKQIEVLPKISEKESKRRIGLPKVEIESRVRRIGNVITYEMETPGVKNKEDVVLTELATGLEIKAYSNNKCYVKFIPLKIEVIEYYVEKEKVFVELKG